jgi:diguanylate cyclase (GGDEF)-like protein
MATCLFWRRFSAIGWGSFFCILLHFFLAFTNKTELLKKWWIYLLLYLPGLLTISAFTYFPSINPGQYNLIRTDYGWTNIAVNNGWDIYYIIYYTSFSLIGFYTMWSWCKDNPDLNATKQTKIVMLSILTSIVLGSVSDILGSMLFSQPVPQLAPIFMIFSLVVIYYTIRKYGLMNPRHQDNEDSLVTDRVRKSIIHNLSMTFIVGSMLHFSLIYFVDNNTKFITALIYSGCLLIAGVVLRIIQSAKYSNDIKEVLITVTIAVIIPIVTLEFLQYGGETVWAVSFIFIIISLVYGKEVHQIFLAIVIIITQIIVWMLKPQALVTTDAVDYISRLIFYTIAIWFALFVKRIYISKIIESANQVKSQKIIAKISTDYISVNESNIHSKTDEALKCIMDFMEADRAYIYMFNPDRDTLTSTHLSIREDKKHLKLLEEKGLITADYPWFMGCIMDEGIISIPDFKRVQEEAGDEFQRLAQRGFMSLLALPIKSSGSLLGLLGVETTEHTKKWSENHIDFLRITSNIMADAFAKVNQEKEIKYMAYYDYLTKMPNRLLFKDRLNQAIYMAQRANKMIAVIFLDINSFKTVNDTMGHEGGDELLIKVSNELHKTIRKSDTVSRFGGDEFLIMLNSIESFKDIILVTDKIMSIFAKPFMLGSHEYFVKANAGIAVYPADGDDADKLIKNADIAMYKAKDIGINQYLLCSSSMKDEALLKMKLSNSLYRALERDELYIHYQPQVSVDTREIIGMEALLRWRHPELGMISPGMFIPIAEQNGLIIPIGEWVLRTACMQNKIWQDLGLPPVRMAVNVSIYQIRNSDLVAQVKAILDETGLSPQYLELEITESVANKEADAILNNLNELKKLGLSISIDDFGTEYSSLSRLSILPIDRVKMDMQFVRNLNKSEKDKAITKGIVYIAHKLGLKLIAEGVETDAQFEYLDQLKCDEVQGYYFYRPLSPEDIEHVIRKAMTLKQK